MEFHRRAVRYAAEAARVDDPEVSEILGKIADFYTRAAETISQRERREAVAAGNALLIRSPRKKRRTS